MQTSGGRSDTSTAITICMAMALRPTRRRGSTRPIREASALREPAPPEFVSRGGRLWPGVLALFLLGLGIAVLVGSWPQSPLDDAGSRDIDVGGSVGESRPVPHPTVVWFGTNILHVTASGPVTLQGLQALGLDAGSYSTFLVPLEGTNGGIGIARDDELPSANRENARPLPGSAVDQDSGYFQLLIKVAVPEGGLRVRGYWLSYQLGGVTRQTFIWHSQHVCDALAEDGRCEEFEPSK